MFITDGTKTDNEEIHVVVQEINFEGHISPYIRICMIVTVYSEPRGNSDLADLRIFHIQSYSYLYFLD